MGSTSAIEGHFQPVWLRPSLRARTARPAEGAAVASSLEFQFPSYSRNERFVDSGIHVLGISLGAIAAAVMAASASQHDHALLVPGIAAYCIGLLAMLIASALYNMAEPSPRKLFLRRLDQAAIFIMIAGSYTPFTLIALGDTWSHALLAAVWLVALIGAALKLLAPGRLERASTALYLLLGWSGLAVLQPLFGTLPTVAFALLVGGGALYSVGVLFHCWKSLPYHKAVWHGFVLAAAACHYGAILFGVVLVAPSA